MESTERPTKRQRLSPPSLDALEATITSNVTAPKQEPAVQSTTMDDSKEADVGITEFVSDDVIPFQALLKKRYTDFIVNEILPDGHVVHLTNRTVSKDLRTSGPARNKGGKNQSGRGNARNGSVETVQIAPSLGESIPSIESATNGPQISQPPPQSGEISTTDKQQLISYLNEKAVDELLDLHKTILANPTRRSKDHATVRTEFTSDRSVRAEIHAAIRKIFSLKIESSTDKDGYLCLMAANPNTRKPQSSNVNDEKPYYPNKLGWLERGGDYLHFSLYKENKDTMEVVSFLHRQMKMSVKSFQFAGTKDRRAVTTQRVSAYRLDAERLAKQNYHLRNSAVGDFEYRPSSLELGDLGGNEFVLTLRECQFSGLSDNSTVNDQALAEIEAALNLALSSLHNRGYLNYYGLQRFGTFTTRTDTIGLQILKNDFRAACESILHYNADNLSLAVDVDNESGAPIANPTASSGPGRDEIERAKAIALFHKTSNAHKALEILPKKFTAENQVMRHLASSPTDYIGALLTIPRNLRLMYVHAYQSLVWNQAATHRWKTYGHKVVEGDLVLIKEHTDKGTSNSKSTSAEAEVDGVDADGEIIIVPSSHDRSNQIDDIFDRARALTASEASSGQYTIFDIVLPLPGYDIEYPTNQIGTFYKTFMGSDEGGNLDPYDMRRKQRDFSLSGGYRKVMARIGGDFEVQVHPYARDEEQFVQTDLEKLIKTAKTKGDEAAKSDETLKTNDADDSQDKKDEEVKDKVAAVLKFQLGASQYATMALRELSRGGVVAYKADFSGGK